MSGERDLREWLKYAEEDFASAQVLFDGRRYATCAYHCQQTLEKVLKAKTHKIEPVGFTEEELQTAGNTNVLSEIRDRGVVISLADTPIEPVAVREDRANYSVEEDGDA